MSLTDVTGQNLEPAAAAWRVVAASVTGVSHERQGSECQDAHLWILFESGLLVAALADGAGSASHGRLGAETASRTAVEALTSQFRNGLDTGWRRCLADTLHAARDAVFQQAVVEDLSARELASTLIVLVATPQMAAAAQIGDGAALVRTTGGEVLALTRPPTDEYINQTTFIVSEDALETAQFRIWNGSVGQVAALTDGLQRLALRMPEGDPHPPFFAPLFQFLKDVSDLELAHRQLEEFLRSPRISERTDDDLTLLLATVTGP